VSRFGRRTFLASSAGVAAGAAIAAGAEVSLEPGGAAGAAGRSITTTDAAAQHSGLVRATGLTVNGLTNPMGIDPDGCSFAWTLHATARAAVQRGFRVVVRRTDPGHAGLAWDSGPVQSGRQAFVPYDGRTLAGDAAYGWTVQCQGAAGTWGPMSAPSSFTTALREADWKASWLIPSAGAQPDRVTYLRRRGRASRIPTSSTSGQWTSPPC
jgi:alpha-L-rhamnosidase